MNFVYLEEKAESFLLYCTLVLHSWVYGSPQWLIHCYWPKVADPKWLTTQSGWPKVAELQWLTHSGWHTAVCHTGWHTVADHRRMTHGGWPPVPPPEADPRGLTHGGWPTVAPMVALPQWLTHIVLCPDHDDVTTLLTVWRVWQRHILRRHQTRRHQTRRHQRKRHQKRRHTKCC